MQANKVADILEADLSLVAPPEIPEATDAAPEQASGNFFDAEVAAYIEAQQAGGDPDFIRKAEIALRDRELKEAAADRELERRMRRDQHDRQMRMIDTILDARKTYANKIFIMVVVWLIAIGLILIVRGWYWKTGFVLTDNVLLALIGGTTLNVLGIFTIVANFLFPKNGGHLLATLSGEMDSKKANGDTLSNEGKTKKSAGKAKGRG